MRRRKKIATAAMISATPIDMDMIVAVVGLCFGTRGRTQIVSTVAGTDPAANSPATRRLHNPNDEGVVGGYYFQLSPMIERLAGIPQGLIRCIVQRVEGTGVGFHRVHAKSSNGGLS